MMRTLYLMVLTVVMSVATTCAAATDDEIRHYLVGSMLYIDNVKGARRDFRRARELCGEDTNRFARLICEIAHTNDSWIAEGMIRDLGTYGTSAQLPFLYSQVSNTTYGADAVQSILEIEGITSNSVAMVDGYFAMTNIDCEYRAEVCKALLYATRNTNMAESVRNYGRSAAYEYMMRANRYVRGMDIAYIDVDPSYTNSKRRLAVLRSVYQLGVSEYQIAYVTNAINELVAYPEADLPD